MANYNDTVSLYNNILKEIAYNEKCYKDYLNFSAIHYKLNFANSVLAYVQKPEATALGTFNGWVNKIGRKVKKNSKGIKLFKTKDGIPGIEYFFDISDTTGTHDTLPIRWQLTPELETNLCNEYQAEISFQEFLNGLINEKIKETLPQYFEQFIIQNKTLSYENFVDSFYTLATNTIKYKVFYRCNCDASKLSFPDIEYYQDLNLAVFLGTSTSLISTEILKEIEHAVLIINERNQKNESELQSRLSNDRRKDTGADIKNEYTKNPDREIWPTGSKISSRNKPNSLRVSSNEWGVDRHSSKRSATGDGNDGNFNRESNQENPSYKSSELSGNLITQEYSLLNRNGGSNEGSHLHPSLEDKESQLSLFNSDVLTSLKEMAQEKEVIEPRELTEIEKNKLFNSILQYGTGKIFDKYRIYEKLYHNKKWDVDFISKIYEMASFPSFTIIFNNKQVQITTNAKGFSISVPNKEDLFLSFNEALTVIGKRDLIFYYTDEERSLFRDLEIAFLASPLEIKTQIWGLYQSKSSLSASSLIPILSLKEWNVFSFCKINIACEDSVVFSGEGSKYNDFLSSSYSFNYEEIMDLHNNLFEQYDYLSYGRFDKTEELERILLRSSFSGGKYRIYDFFTRDFSTSEKISLLKGEFGQGGGAGAILSHNEYGGYDTFGKGIKIHCDLYPTHDYSISWSEAVSCLDKIVKENRYFTLQELKIYESINDLSKFLYKEYYEELSSFKQYGYTLSNETALHQLFEEKEIKFPLNNREIATAIFNSSSISISLEDIKASLQYSRLCELFKIEAQNYTETIAGQLESLTDLIEETSIPTIINSNESAFHIDDSFDLYAGPKTKFKQNVEAINLLNTLQLQNRILTNSEKEILAKYSGWGGLAYAFDEKNSSWEKEYKILKALLSPEDYNFAKASTLTSYYTDKPIIDFMYSALKKFGFTSGKILEPALAVGHFYGRLPTDFKDSQLFGVEIDPIPGNIAKYLYPKAHITIKGFEDVDFEDNYFDVVIGNVPFGDFKIFDARYNKHNFLIHDYFFAKALDKLKPGGILAFVTSSGTLDKANPSVRKYLSEIAELVGAVRLPNTAFKKIAGTEVTSDIVFLKKKLSKTIDNPGWIGTGYTPNGFIINQYFIDNPNMILGEIDYDTRFGKNERNTLCIAPEGFKLESALNIALDNLTTQFNITVNEKTHQTIQKQQDVIPANPDVRNFTYCFINDKLYYRENTSMFIQNVSGKTLERIKGLHKIRQIVRSLIELQTNGCSEYELIAKQTELNDIYDTFVSQNGYITSKENKRAFLDDNDYPLLSSLEYLDEKENIKKADIFTKQTINPNVDIISVDTASEALMVSLNIKGYVNIPYMSDLCHQPSEKVISDLSGQIFINPEKYNPGSLYSAYEPADEYLSGNVRDKLMIAKTFAQTAPELFSQNVEVLEKVQPEKIEAADIHVKLGVNWIDVEDYEAFLYEICSTPLYLQKNSSRKCILINYNRFDGSWSLANKRLHSYGTSVTETYGTKRMTAYEIFEASLNQRQALVKDRLELGDGKYKYVTNRKETEIAKEKQALIQENFREWLFRDSEKREKYVTRYNEMFNSIRLREFDGGFQTFPNMNPEISLRKHQLAAIARAKFNGNTLLAHAVGAGKTFEMDAIIMEKKRLGLIKKACMVVPNHLTDQAATELLTLYPSANILLTTKKDFEKANRKRFISRISTGDYDCVIMGASQFEKIPMSKEYQQRILEEEFNEVISAIESLEFSGVDGETKRYSVKQLERTKKSLEVKIKTLLDDSKKDDLITFEQLGFDFIAVDEAHNYKNCSIFTKMNNVSGISVNGAKKSYDLLTKCKYINDLSGYKNIVFATGTPVANSMTELFTMSKYLRPDILARQDLLFFDNWAAEYGEIVASLELAPAGNGFRLRQRFARFVNLPELLTTFKEFADVQTSDMLNLPIPDLKGRKPITITADPDETQKLYIDSLAERMEAIHNGGVDPSLDNALKITHEARLLGTDARLLLPDADNNPESKVNLCVNNIYDIYNTSSATKGSQIIFCDVGTPKYNTDIFDLYTYIKSELVCRGIPEREIAFAHDAKNEKERAMQFTNIRNGNIRVIIASTAKMGTGANIQKNLIALHHLDIPWKPSDLEQRNGRILRQGNENKEVAIYQYVTKGTFDSYMWSILENKQKFISQIINSKAVARACEDIDESVLNYAEVKAIATGDPRIKEKMELDMEINRLQTLKSSYVSSKHRIQDKIEYALPNSINNLKQKIELIKIDIDDFNKVANSEFSITIKKNIFTEREAAGQYLFSFKKDALKTREPMEVGDYKGFKLYLLSKNFDGFDLILKGAGNYSTELSDNHLGSMIKLDNLLKGLSGKLQSFEQTLDEKEKDISMAKIEYEKPFIHEENLLQKIKRQIELNSELSLDKVDDIIADETLEEALEEILENRLDFDEVEALDEKTIKTFSKRR